jgi:hypothetical protein
MVWQAKAQGRKLRLTQPHLVAVAFYGGVAYDAGRTIVRARNLYSYFAHTQYSPPADYKPG